MVWETLYVYQIAHFHDKGESGVGSALTLPIIIVPGLRVEELPVEQLRASNEVSVARSPPTKSSHTCHCHPRTLIIILTIIFNVGSDFHSPDLCLC